MSKLIYNGKCIGGPHDGVEVMKYLSVVTFLLIALTACSDDYPCSAKNAREAGDAYAACIQVGRGWQHSPWKCGESSYDRCVKK